MAIAAGSQAAGGLESATDLDALHALNQNQNQNQIEGQHGMRVPAPPDRARHSPPEGVGLLDTAAEQQQLQRQLHGAACSEASCSGLCVCMATTAGPLASSVAALMCQAGSSWNCQELQHNHIRSWPHPLSCTSSPPGRGQANRSRKERPLLQNGQLMWKLVSECRWPESGISMQARGSTLTCCRGCCAARQSH